ncbi:alpha/beta fold hydrolase [Streptomyces sp. NBC_00160]|uniref:alpha/beta hydrolase family protein n=1 Tax=Streptomyces sp. NBC_00160 TaxID=2903628 RepID=UPI00224EA746|nr:alpha/beta fold hydrolase [Streptomyces sp. NBC_00160]MCX5309288.1 alpha/beta fold hydrolase [Streptomyces sp. NBC_00160]
MSEPACTAATLHSPAPVLSVGPVVLPAPGRAVDLQVRISAPVTGSELPVILLSHGLGLSNNLSSMNGYAPLAHVWAARGFVVIQPTHLDSRTLSLAPDASGAPGAAAHWRTRAEDMTRVLDRLAMIEDAVPQLAGRLDRSRVAVAGHSMGGHTASLLLGARLTDPRDGTEADLADPRIRAGVLLAAPGRGGDALTEFTAENYPFLLTTDFSTMTAPALVVAPDGAARDSATAAAASYVRGRGRTAGARAVSAGCAEPVAAPRVPAVITPASGRCRGRAGTRNGGHSAAGFGRLSGYCMLRERDLG